MIIINYILFVVLGTGWAVGILGFHSDREVHILLILAMITAAGIIGHKDISLEGENHILYNV